MAELSISRAWDETKHIIAHDGRLLASVALALVALPAALSGLLDPTGRNGMSGPGWAQLLLLLTSLLTLAGQLALIRLAIGPSITVGGAIAHGLKRTPIYLLAAILIVLVLMALAVPFAIAMTALGVRLDAKDMALNGPVVVFVLLFVALVFFACVRMLMSGPIASAETAGPIGIISRSWKLTAGYWWRLFGFLMLFFIGAIVVLFALNAATGAVASLLLGPIEPMSASALVVALVGSVGNAAITAIFAVMLARIYLQLAGGGATEATVPKSGT